MKSIDVGTKLQWSSGAGVLVGTVESIRLALNAADEMCAWIMVGKVSNLTEGKTYREDYRIQLNGTDGYMKMMKFVTL